MDFFIECNRCGKCKEFCPSYKIFLNESFSPRGRLRLIKAFEEKEICESKSLKQRILSCLICGACENVCPLDVHLSSLVYHTRAKMKKSFLLYFFKYFSLYPRLFFSALQYLNRFGFSKFQQFSFLNKFSFFDDKMRKQNFIKVYSKLKPKGRIALFNGCSTNYLMPSIVESLIYILNWLNFEVIVPKQNCCGAPLLGAGFKEEAIKLAQKNLALYKSFNIDGIITPCPTCSHFIEEVYKELIGDNINILKIADLFDEKRDFLENLVHSETLSYTEDVEEFNTLFHISCHSFNYIKDYEKIFYLLQKLNLSNIHSNTGCCGFAGLFSFLFEEQSIDILRKKVLKYKNIDMIVTSCPNCIIQFKFAIKNKKVLHYIEIIHKILLEGEKNGRPIKFEFF